MTEPTLDEEVLKSWIGKTETTSDLVTAHQAQLLAATLDRDSNLKDGDPLPPLWHWIYFLSPSRLGELGRDGHPKLGGFIPPVALPRRMWAGGRFEFAEPVLLGEELAKQSTIKDVALKDGRTGKLCFVTVRHKFSGTDNGLRMAEEHDVVYREDPTRGSAPPEPPLPPQGGEWVRTITPSPIMLFRYSALTFNGHRIHYDIDYCREVEGYPGLVFHGPLAATLLAGMAVEHADGRPLKHFSFRALAPLFGNDPLVIRGKPDSGGETMNLWAETPSGRLAMSAEAVF